MRKADLDTPLTATPFRWIETQAPQFPAQHASRNYAAWERMRLRMKSGK